MGAALLASAMARPNPRILLPPGALHHIRHIDAEHAGNLKAAWLHLPPQLHRATCTQKWQNRFLLLPLMQTGLSDPPGNSSRDRAAMAESRETQLCTQQRRPGRTSMTMSQMMMISRRAAWWLFWWSRSMSSISCSTCAAAADTSAHRFRAQPDSTRRLTLHDDRV